MRVSPELLPLKLPVKETVPTQSASEKQECTIEEYTKRPITIPKGKTD
jgi:hypothetical protein